MERLPAGSHRRLARRGPLGALQFAAAVRRSGRGRDERRAVPGRARGRHAVPQNWLRPRFRGSRPARREPVRAPPHRGEPANPLVVYTTATTWTMPARCGTALAQHTVDAADHGHRARRDAVRGTTLSSASELGSIGPARDRAGRGARRDRLLDDERRHRRCSAFTSATRPSMPSIRPADAEFERVVRRLPHVDARRHVRRVLGERAIADNGDPAQLGMLTADGTHGTPPFVVERRGDADGAHRPGDAARSRKLHWQAGDHVALTMFPVSGKFEITWTDLETASTTQAPAGACSRAPATRNAAPRTRRSRTRPTPCCTSARRAWRPA